MNKLEYIKQYENVELCKKYDNNIPLNELDSPEFNLEMDSQDIESILEHFGSLINSNIIKGVVASLGDGDYKEVYVTESSRPYDLSSVYHPLSYYLE